MNKRKADLANLSGLVIGLVVIGIVLTVGFLISAQMKTQVVAETSTSKTYNETAAWTNNTYVRLTNNTGQLELACTEVLNSSTAHEVIDSGNYTCSPSGINLVDRTTTGIDTWNTSGVIVTYTWKEETYAYNASGEVQNVTQDIPGWLGIIVVTVIGSLLITLIVKLFKR